MSYARRGAAVAVALALLSFGAWAEEKDSKEKLDDATFVMKAGSGNMHEVTVAELAVARAADDDVKTFAQQMIKDHNKAQDGLKDAAKAAGLKLPAKMSKKHQDVCDRFEKIEKGKGFDTAYMKHMVESHTQSVALYESASKQLKNEELKKFAEKTLPTVKHHLKKAKDLNEKVGKEKSK